MNSIRTIRSPRHFVRHFLEMVIAMAAGMILLEPIWPELPGQVELQCLVMATDMTIGMTGLMMYRRHSWQSIAEMAAAMYAPFLVLFGLFWAGVVSAATVFLAGHLLMLPAMALVMSRRPDEYATGHPQRAHRVPDLPSTS